MKVKFTTYDDNGEHEVPIERAFSELNLIRLMELLIKHDIISYDTVFQLCDSDVDVTEITN